MAKLFFGAIIWIILFGVLQILFSFIIDNDDLRAIIVSPIALITTFFIIFREPKTDVKKTLSRNVIKKVEESNNPKSYDVIKQTTKEFNQSKEEKEQDINKVIVKGHPVTGETVHFYSNEKGELYCKLWLTGKFSTPWPVSEKIEMRYAYVHFGPFSNEEARNKIKSQIYQKEGELYKLKGRIIAIESTNDNGGQIQYSGELSDKRPLIHNGKPIYRKYRWVAASNRCDDILERDSGV